MTKRAADADGLLSQMNIEAVVKVETDEDLIQKCDFINNI